MQRGSTTDYYEADGLGTVTSLTATNGSIAESYTYDSFGNTTASTGTVRNYFQYTGREFDTETGLYYYRARYYDPTTGRFLSEDPLRLPFGSPLNFYVYVYNHPTKYLDPSGNDPVIGATVGAIVGGIYGGVGAAADPNASVGDIVAGALTGALGGGIVGALDPTLGIGTVVAISAGGDLLGQVVTGHGFNKCKPINWGSTLGAAAGGALGAWGGELLAGGGEGWLITAAKGSITSGPGALLPGIGAHLLSPATAGGCECEN